MKTKQGRPHKGTRELMVTRPAAPLGAAVRASAEREGYDSISEYVAAVLAQHEKLPQYAPRPHQKEVLDIPA